MSSLLLLNFAIVARYESMVTALYSPYFFDFLHAITSLPLVNASGQLLTPNQHKAGILVLFNFRHNLILNFQRDCRTKNALLCMLGHVISELCIFTSQTCELSSSIRKFLSDILVFVFNQNI